MSDEHTDPSSPTDASAQSDKSAPTDLSAQSDKSAPTDPSDKSAPTDPSASAHPAPIPVAIIDDHSIFRSGLRADLDDRLVVIAEAADVDAAVAAILSSRPGVVLLDVHLPGGAGGGGAEVVRRTISQCPDTRFLALSVSDAAEDVVGVIRAGARGYLTKGSSGSQVSDAVVAVASGDAVFSPRLAGFVLDAFGVAAGEQAETTDELDRLSAREREVMRLIARGHSYKEVAADLFISIKTVETHVSAVLRKLQLSSRHELTAWALERKLL